MQVQAGFFVVARVSLVVRMPWSSSDPRSEGSRHCYTKQLCARGPCPLACTNQGPLVLLVIGLPLGSLLAASLLSLQCLPDAGVL